MRLKFVAGSFFVFALIGAGAFFVSLHFLWALLLVLPVVAMGVVDMVQRKQAIRRNFPLIGRLRYVMEFLRPAIQQYFVESDLSGRPFNRRARSLVYQRAKKQTETVPFGTQVDVYEEGYEWMAHSTYPLDYKKLEQHPRVRVGGRDCQKPYDLSIFNVSAMSYGSLSKQAVLSLNGGAKKGGFAHNTGEGGVSPYHLENGGDLIWQIGTGYFGCRAEGGGFSAERFVETLKKAAGKIKMVEIKLSQGAKPGHGGILPAAKNTPEIAAIRGVQPHTDVLSPPFHTAFGDAKGLVQFIKTLRDLSEGLPIGFKLCIGAELEFYEICREMTAADILPDFITVDGGEGGTGAAPVEFSDSLGMPLREGLSFVADTLRGFDIRQHIRIIASGRVTTGFDLAKTIALGADACNSARGMMLALGCIQALECNTNKCPTGVATQDPKLAVGLDVGDKTERIYNFHHKTIHAFVELIAAAGLSTSSLLQRKHIYRRITASKVMRYDQLYPIIPTGCLVGKSEIPEVYRRTMLDA